MSNDANLLSGRVPSNDGDNLPPISGAGGFNTTVGFGGGTSNILYNDEDKSYNIFITKQDEVLPWKKFNSNMAISVEYDLEY